jgi:hypothetical protein
MHMDVSCVCIVQKKSNQICNSRRKETHAFCRLNLPTNVKVVFCKPAASRKNHRTVRAHGIWLSVVQTYQITCGRIVKRYQNQNCTQRRHVTTHLPMIGHELSVQLNCDVAKQTASTSIQQSPIRTTVKTTDNSCLNTTKLQDGNREEMTLSWNGRHRCYCCSCC